MRALPFVRRGLLLAAILLFVVGCGRKGTFEGGGSSNTQDDGNKSVEVAQKNTSKSTKSAKNGSGLDSIVNDLKKSDGPVIPQPKKPSIPSTPPEWENVRKQEWAPNEKVILSAEDAQNYIPGTLRVSPDGGSFAYARKFTGGEAMFVDGKELNRFKSISPTLIEFSKDSKHIVYAGQISDADGYGWGLDDQINRMSKVERLGAFYYVQKFFLTPDASEMGFHVNGNYVVANGKYLSDTNGYSCVFNTTEKLHYAELLTGMVRVDGVDQKKFEAISGFQFSDNGRNFAYVVTQSGEQFVVFGKSEERPYQKVDSLVLSPDGKRYAHRVEHEGKQYLVVDGKPKPYPGTIRRPVLFSPDSSRWAIVINNKVVVDHVEDLPVGVSDSFSQPIDASSLVFSPDSKHYAYFGTDSGKRVVYLDGKKQGQYDALAKIPLFSSDGQSMAYLAQDGGKWAIYINGKRHAEVPHDPEGRCVLEFSPDSKSIGYAASVDLVWYILLDGKLIEKNEPIGAEGSRIGFGPDGSFTYVVKRKNAYYWVTEKRK